MSTTPGTRNRPGSVTIVTVLLWISFAFWILTAIAAFFTGTGLTAAGDQAQIEQELKNLGLPESWAPGVGPTFLVIGGVLVVFAIISALFAVFIGRGSNVARILLTVVIAIRALGTVSSLFATDLGIGLVFTAVVSIAIDVVILFLLFNAEASRFFTDEVRVR
jgi:hypothetical protein